MLPQVSAEHYDRSMLTGSLILIVDDQADMRDLLRDMLQINDYRVVEAVNRPSALAAVAEHNPDLMILDHMMPKLKGIDVLRRLRNQQSRLPVILLTAYGNDAVTWEGWAAGASVFMDKPFEASELLGWVATLLQRPDPGPEAEILSTHDLMSHQVHRSQLRQRARIGALAGSGGPYRDYRSTMTINALRPPDDRFREPARLLLQVKVR